MSWISEVCSFSITGNAGGAVTPVTDNINIIGSGSLVVTGDPVLGTLTISGGGVTGMTQHALAVGTAGGSITSLTLGTTGTVLTGVTGADPAFSASPTLTAVYATTFDTNVAAAGVTLAGTSLIADGTDADIDINITAKGAGTVVIDELTLTTDLAVTEGGTGASSLTDHSVLVGSGTGAITAIAVGATNQVLLGATGADPVWGTVPNAALTNSSITLSNGNNITVTGSPVSLGGTATIAVTGTTDHAIQLGNVSGSLTSLGLGTQYQILQSGGAGDAAWSTLTFPNTSTQGDILYSSANNVISLLNKDATATRYLSNTGASNNPAWAQVNLANGVTGTLPVGNGGTGQTTLTVHGVLIGNATSGISATSAGTAGQILTSSGAGADPVWTTATYPATAAIGDVLVASAANTIGVVTGAATAGHVLTANGAGSAPTFQALPAPVVGSFASDAETIAGTVTNKAVAPSNLKAKLGLQTVHALPVGNSDSLALGWLAVGTDGTVLVGNTAADPSFSANPTLTTVYATTFDTNVAAAAVTLSGTTLSADGTDADININITAKGSGQVIIDDLQLTTDLAVTEGGTGASTLLDHGLLVGSGTAAVDALAVGTTGTILTGVTGADPTWTTATYPATAAIGDVLVASAANTLGVVAGATTAGYALIANGVGTAPTFQAIGASMLPATVPTSFSTDAGSATPALNVLTVTGGTNIGTAGAGSTVTVNLDSTITLTGVNATTFDTNVAAAGLTLSGTTLSADGSDADININITAKGSGTVIIDELTLSTDLAVSEGGTGASTLTDHGVLVGSGTGAITPLAVGATGEALIGNTGADPSWSTNLPISTVTVATGGAIRTGTTDTNTLLLQAYDVDGTAYITFATLTAGNTPTMDLDTAVTIGTKYIYRADGTDVPVTDGGTGASTLTDHGILLGSGTSAITATAAPTDGQLLIGSTGNDPSLATITAGTGISVNNGAGTITIASTVSALAWSEITDATKTIVNQEAYVANRGTQIVFTLPATAALGTEFKIQGKNSGGWKIEQAAGQTIHVGSSASTTGAAGYIESTDDHDAITLVCITADTDWATESVVGNITVA